MADRSQKRARQELSSELPTRDGDTTSLWMADTELPQRERLDHDVSVEVCIVGAGIAGLTTAYLLSREGRSVIVIDDKPPGGGQTARTTAHLSAVLDDGFHRLEQLHGRTGARAAVQSHAFAIDQIESICGLEAIDCGFTRLDEYLYTPPEVPPDKLTRDLEREAAAARRAGLAVEWVPRAPLGFDTGPCLKFGQQAQFHPLAYTNGLVRAIEMRGGRIYSQTHADIVRGGDLARIQTGHGPTITAAIVIVATNVPVNDLAVIHTKQAPHRSYVITARIPRGSIPLALYSDTLDPYHYVRIEQGNEFDTLIVGGEDHRTGQDQQPERKWARLVEWAQQRFPMMGEVDRLWSGQILEPVDGLGFIGRNPMDADNVYIATGDSGHGMTHGTIAGILLTDLIQNRQNPWTELYSPTRRSLRAVTDFMTNQLNVAAQYAEWFQRGDVGAAEAIPLGQGAVVRRGLRLIATYMDLNGVRHECSAACPHMGGVVHWNRAEHTWDCPCHGSRFDPYGRVVEGPAITGLTPIEPEDPSRGDPLR
ncbi:MAG: FAD-dependent oxidoreductase [Kofleriaceae bacterium]